MESADIVRAFWQAMRTNDWTAAAAHLTEDFRGIWPQTGEVMDGRAGFIAMQSAFPGQGHWQFEELALFGDDLRVVSDMRVTNPTLDMTARAITFHDVDGILIRQQTEFWPDPYPIPEWRVGLARHRPDLARF